MKSYLYLLIIVVFTACSANSVDKNCNFLPNDKVERSINISLPQYSQLAFVTNPVYVPNLGNGGVFVTKTGDGYVAFDAADPNHNLSSCSILRQPENKGIIGVCGCEDANSYNLINGLPMNNPELRCALKMYRAEKNGNEILIYN